MKFYLAQAFCLATAIALFWNYVVCSIWLTRLPAQVIDWLIIAMFYLVCKILCVITHTKPITRTDIKQALVRGYCSPESSGVQVDVDLIDAMTEEVVDLFQKE